MKSDRVLISLSVFYSKKLPDKQDEDHFQRRFVGGGS